MSFTQGNHSIDADRIYTLSNFFSRRGEFDVCLWMGWEDVISISPNAIRPSSWPEPDGWFWGWNREEKLKLSEIVRIEG